MGNDLLLQKLVDGRPTYCDWCRAAVTDEYFEADAWYLCSPCYGALMDGTTEEFNARFREKV